MPENVAVAPPEVDHDVDAAARHQSDLRDRLSGAEDDLALVVAPLPGSQTAQHGPDLLLPDAVEQARVGQEKMVHESLRPVHSVDDAAIRWARSHQSGAIIANCSGRGDKDLDYVLERYGDGSDRLF